jgi:hypothetical protein
MLGKNLWTGMTSGEFDRLALARAKFAFGNFVARSESAVIPLTFLSRGSVIIPGVFW